MIRMSVEECKLNIIIKLAYDGGVMGMQFLHMVILSWP